MDIFSYIAFIIILFGISVASGGIIAPIIVRILELLSKKTASTLDDRIISAIKTPLNSFFVVSIFYVLLNTFPELVDAVNFINNYTYAIFIILASFMVSEILGAIIRWYFEEGHKGARVIKLDLSLLPLLRKLTKLIVYAMGLTLALSSIGFDVAGLLTITSVIGIILGLASQETLANIFAGVALQIDRPFNYKDYLRIPTGEVVRLEKIGMRSTKLTDMSNNTVIVSNSEFAKMRVVRLSSHNDIGVYSALAEFPLSCDLEKLKKSIISELEAANPKGLVPENGYKLTIEAVKPSSVQVAFHFWVKGYANVENIRGIVNKAFLDFARKSKST